MGLDDTADSAAEATKENINDNTGQTAGDDGLKVQGKVDQIAADTKKLIQNEEARDALT